MPGIFDALQGMMGRADPSAQLYAALGQGPGGPGSPAGAQPGGGGAGAPQQQQPQVYQSSPDLAQAYAVLAGGGQANAPQAPSGGSGQPPPDLAKMYMAAQQRDQASNQFYSGLGLMAAGMYPGRNPNASMKWAQDQQRDPASLFQNLVQLQQYQQQNQALQAYRQGIPKMLTDAGISQDYAPLVAANPNLLGDILKSRMGLTGDPAERALQAARNDWLNQNSGKTESDMLKEHPEYSDPISFGAAKTGAATAEATTQKATQEDIQNAKNDVVDLDAQHTKVEGILAKLNADPGAVVAAVQNLGPTSGWSAKLRQGLPTALGGLPQNVSDAAGQLLLLHNVLYSEGWKGRGGRLSQQEAKRIGDSFDNLSNPALSETEIKDQLSTLTTQELTAHNNALAAGGQPVPAQYWPKVNSIYKKGGARFAGATPLDDDSSTTSAGGGGGGGGGGSAPAGPPMPNAQKASDGNWYVPDPARPGKYLRVD